MNKIQQLTSKVVSSVKNNSPAILTGLAVTGVISTSVLAGKATVKSLYLIEAENAERYQSEYPALNNKEVVKLVWKTYIPTAVLATATIVSIIGANTVNSRRNAALVGLYTLTESTLKEYQDKVAKHVEPKVLDKIKDEIIDDKLKANPEDKAIIHMTGGGDVLCFDVYSGRYFNSSQENINKAVNEVNRMMIYDWSASLNEFYSKLGLPSIELGELVGWSTDDMVDIYYRSKVTEDGKPCLVIDHHNAPHAGFQSF